MQITYKNSKIKKVCTDYKRATKEYGKPMADKIHQRVDEISAAESVEFMERFHIGGCHLLKGDRKGQYAVHLIEPHRLVFEEVEGNIKFVAIIEIIDDYH